MLYDVPVIISRQSGVAEVLPHARTADFWDIEELAEQIVSVLTHPAEARETADLGRRELRALRWEAAAEQVERIYERLVPE